jgi:hypothetical protein
MDRHAREEEGGERAVRLERKLAILAVALWLIAVGFVVWKASTHPCVEYSTVHVPARVVERARTSGGTTVVPAHDEVVCVKR